MFGLSRNQENLLAEYKAIISDQRDQLRAQSEVISDLTDKLIAMSSPAILREVKRPSPVAEPAQASGPSNNQKRRMHWPGREPDLRPPSPSSLPTPATFSEPKAPVLSDNQIMAAVRRAGENQDGG